ncbi:MAG: hypothetical protein KA319_08630 [Ferruginibacter sp.]|nr:hypothetical protein [Ferruginibacter sp.]
MKKNKRGKFNINLPVNSDKEELEVLFVINEEKKAPKKHRSDFAGKMQWKGNPIDYQKKIRDEWS